VAFGRSLRVVARPSRAARTLPQRKPAMERGAANLLAPECTLAALQSMRKGHAYDLSHVIETGAPLHEAAKLV